MNLKLIHCTFFILLLLFISCGNDDPPPLEEEEEVITEVNLTFTSNSGEMILATAKDPDGEGPQNIEIVDEINLSPNSEYTLSISLLNTIANENITDEVRDEGQEHQFFFSWNEGIFTSPVGNGNIDNPLDPINYIDSDINGLPIGLLTSWSTGEMSSGTMRVLLKHQPGSKNNSSGSGTGDTDIDLTWPININ